MLEEEGHSIPPELLNNVAVLYHLDAKAINSFFDPSYRKNFRISAEGTSHSHLFTVLSSAESLYQRALVTAASNEYRSSEENWKVNAIQTIIRYNVALLFETRGEVEKAETHFKEILKIHPSFEDCNLDLLGMLRIGKIQDDRNNNSEALDYYSNALALDPENAIAWYLVGNHHLKTKSYRAARKSFEKVLLTNTHDIYALCSAGNLCLIFARGDPDPNQVFTLN